MAYIRFYKELRLLQKAANERMRQLEKKGFETPAYRAVQARLEVMGKQTKGTRGRRFSETGKATYTQMKHEMKILKDFLDAQTSTLKGAKKYYKDVWEGANKKYNLTEAGITPKQWFDLWENLPQKKKERIYDSEEYISILAAYTKKDDKMKREGELTIEQIVKEVEKSENIKEAWKSVGLSWEEVATAKNLL